jgi:hypothetical protein
MSRTGCVVAVAVVAAGLAGCGRYGPRTLPKDRFEYGTSIATSWQRQTLLNIVKLRYLDFPVFLEVAQIVSGYQVESALELGFSAREFLNAFNLGGTAAGSGRYIDRPTTVYVPLTGTDFMKHLMAPIPPAAIFFLIQSGYPADLVLRVSVAAVNGLENTFAGPAAVRPADPRFVRLTELLHEAQMTNASQMRIERRKDGTERVLISFPPRQRDAETTARVDEIRSLLGLRRDASEFEVSYGAVAANDREIALLTRSMLTVMVQQAVHVDVPPDDVAEGRAWPRMEAEASAAPFLRIHAGDARPPDAAVAVRHRGHWFWVDDRDLRSKRTFGFLMLLFSVAETGSKEPMPVVTIPAQ